MNKMYALGIPKKQYKRTTQVLRHERSKPILFKFEKQEDGFYMFYFPEADEYDFKDIVKLLKSNGVTTIGADNQLTEKNIMKLANLINLKEQNTTSGEFNVEIPVQDVDTKVNIKYGHVTGPLDDVTISWGDESHNVDFEFEETVGDAQAYDEFDIDTYVAYSEDDKWRFIVPVKVTPRKFSGDGGTVIEDESAVEWDDMEIVVDDSKLGGAMDDDDVDRAFTVDAPDRSLQEQFQRRAGIIK